jgi:hypothetical protein
MGVRGRAFVQAVSSCPPIAGGAGRIVLGTVAHLNENVLRLHFLDAEETLEPTVLHPLFSLDRKAWVRAGHLKVGERLRTADGEVTIAAIDRLAGARRVYNLEVARDHTYLVSQLAVHAHNACGDAGGGPLPSTWQQDAQVLTDYILERLPNGKVGNYLTNGKVPMVGTPDLRQLWHIFRDARTLRDSKQWGPDAEKILNDLSTKKPGDPTNWHYPRFRYRLRSE